MSTPEIIVIVQWSLLLLVSVKLLRNFTMISTGQKLRDATYFSMFNLAILDKGVFFSAAFFDDILL